MFRRSFFFRLLAVIVFLGLLASAGTMLYRAGQAQGYAIGASAAAAQGGDSSRLQVQPPPGPYAYPGYYGYRPFFFPMMAPFGFLFFIGWIFFLFFIVGGLFRFMAFGRFGRGRAGWHHHHHDHPAEDQPQQPAEPAE